MIACPFLSFIASSRPADLIVFLQKREEKMAIGVDQSIGKKRNKNGQSMKRR